ncbi:hypothetical protein BZG36_03455 [Bifiguratus adelaidae]|uniref:Uncharacterized protein n=1 Tax=Bifiguratus adelaidae TaxID=1938954 RepID=A0A261XY00_9FUNG|nr:hypothetical protein BZG36_03455 [Bifiguratus adelaidae]
MHVFLHYERPHRPNVRKGFGHLDHELDDALNVFLKGFMAHEQDDILFLFNWEDLDDFDRNLVGNAFDRLLDRIVRNGGRLGLGSPKSFTVSRRALDPSMSLPELFSAHEGPIEAILIGTQVFSSQVLPSAKREWRLRKVSDCGKARTRLVTVNASREEICTLDELIITVKLAIVPMEKSEFPYELCQEQWAE